MENGIFIDQSNYSKRLKSLSLGPSFHDFRSIRQKLLWLSHTRPDIAFPVNKTTQINKEHFNMESIRNVNCIIKHVHKYPTRGILQQKLDKSTMHLRVYADGSFADNIDMRTQLGLFVLMVDGNDRCNILNYRSYKSKSVAQSVLGGELYAIADVFYALAIREDLSSILMMELPVKVFTDSKSLFDAISKNAIMTEKSLIVDVPGRRESYIVHKISDIGWIRSKHNPVDALTKWKQNTVLEQILDEHS